MLRQCPSKLGLALGLLLGCGAATGNDGIPSTAVIEDRIEVMKAMKNHVKVIADMVRGREQFDPVVMANAAQQIADNAPHIPSYFPLGSLRPPSNALPAIWQKMDRFEQLSQELQHNALMIVADAGQANMRRSKQQFRELGRTCAACHKHFRQKQDDE